LDGLLFYQTLLIW